MNKKEKLVESTIKALQEAWQELPVKNIYKTKEEVPYKTRTYLFGNDGESSIDHYNELIRIAKNQDPLKLSPASSMVDEWSFDPWNNWGYNSNLTKAFYLNDLAKQYKLKTEIILLLNQDYKDKVPSDSKYDTDGMKNVYFYRPEKIKVKIQAGSESAFDESRTLSAYGDFELDDMEGIKDFIETENERILNNINPEADHNRVSDETSEAMRYNRIYGG